MERRDYKSFCINLQALIPINIAISRALPLFSLFVSRIFGGDDVEKPFFRSGQVILVCSRVLVIIVTNTSGPTAQYACKRNTPQFSLDFGLIIGSLIRYGHISYMLNTLGEKTCTSLEKMTRWITTIA